jgi:hypothetical protein
MKTVVLCAPESVLEKDATLIQTLKKSTAKDAVVEVRPMRASLPGHARKRAMATCFGPRTTI